MQNNHKPMLAVDCGGLDTLTFPLIVSPKLDGVRAIVSESGLLSRTLKAIPNRHVQALYNGLPAGLDGELIAGDPCAPDAYRKTVSMVMSEDADITGLCYHVFDLQTTGGFRQRFTLLRGVLDGLVNAASTTLVDQIHVPDATALTMLEEQWIKRGYEGAILRKPDGPYKHGRSTRNEGYLLKLKRFADSEAEVINVTELMHNGNVAKTNALGRTERSTHKDGLTRGGTLGALCVRDCNTGVEFEIGTGFNAEDRAEMWAHPPIGQIAKYKYFAGGSKDRPRFPVFLGWRAAIDR